MPLDNFESPYVKVNVARFPIVDITMLPEVPTSEQMDDYIIYYDKLHSQPNPFVMLMEFPKQMVFMKANERIKFGNWMKNNKEKMKVCKAAAFVMTNPIHNVLMKGVFLVQTPEYEYTVVNSMEKAEKWLDEKMAEYGIIRK